MDLELGNLFYTRKILKNSFFRVIFDIELSKFKDSKKFKYFIKFSDLLGTGTYLTTYFFQ
jgi:hypothetical protein